MKKLTSNCDLPTLCVSVLWFLLDVLVLLYWFATAEKIEAWGVCNGLFWTALSLMFVIGLYREGTK